MSSADFLYLSKKAICFWGNKTIMTGKKYRISLISTLILKAEKRMSTDISKPKNFEEALSCEEQGRNSIYLESSQIANNKVAKKYINFKDYTGCLIWSRTWVGLT